MHSNLSSALVTLLAAAPWGNILVDVAYAGVVSGEVVFAEELLVPLDGELEGQLDGEIAGQLDWELEGWVELPCDI
jgi:hypothetical protein